MKKLFYESRKLAEKKDEIPIVFEDIVTFSNIFFALYVIYDRLAFEIALDYLKNNEKELLIYKKYTLSQINKRNQEFHNRRDVYFFTQIDKGNLRNYLKRKCKNQITKLVESINNRQFVLFYDVITDKRDKKLEQQIISDIQIGEKKGAEKYLVSLKRLLTGVRNNIFHGQKILRTDQISILMHASQVLACWNYKLGQQCSMPCESLRQYYE